MNRNRIVPVRCRIVPVRRRIKEFWLYTVMDKLVIISNQFFLTGMYIIIKIVLPSEQI